MQSSPLPTNFYSSSFQPGSPFPSSNGTEAALPPITAKRNQVKNACTNCQKACKKCDDARPCPRCTKYGIADSCVSSVRKERKKGIKRGPYKRRQKSTDDKIENKEGAAEYTPSLVDANGVSTTSTTTTTAAPTATTAATAPSTTATDYGYPSQLSQYGQYYAYPANGDNKDNNILSTQFVLPVYSGYPPPVLVDGDTTTTTQENADDKDVVKKESSPEDDNVNNTSYLAHQALSIILNSATNNDANTAGIYYNNTIQEKDKNQPLTPVPSTSNTSGTASPSETHDEDEKFTRLTELCTAALRENLESKNKEAAESSENGK